MFQFTDLREELVQYLDRDQVAAITDAYLMAAEAHEGQRRRTGEAYITHPVAVARILAGMRMDHESIMAALLHDVLEDTHCDKAELEKRFGKNVAELVDGVSKLTQIKFENRAEAQAENFRKMLLAMVRDIRVILVKLADRLHNMRTLNALPPDKRRRIARETLEIYAPIANRLGIHRFRVEFEDLGFCALYPMRARVLREAVKKARGNRKEIIKNIENSMRTCLIEGGVSPDSLEGREKHLYSIYKKMHVKGVSLGEIMDVYAFRIIVDDLDSCYRVLGLVHNLYKPVLGRFKDYIAIPKANGYQSLHTTLFGPYGVPIEIQIRTHEMHQLAEQGIAAHWFYKTPETSVNHAQSRARAWLKSLLELQKNAGTSIEFIENVKIDLFPDEVYIFTPNGDIMELPSGATAVDFAYSVHTDIGNSCVAARIDRHLAPLSAQLVNGQTVEVITAPGARPNPAWLSFVVTSKARSNIRHFLKSQRRSEAIILGARLLEMALSSYSLTVDTLPKEAVDALLAEAKLADLDSLYAEIGMGNRNSLLVARRVLDLGGLNPVHPGERARPRLSDTPLAIKGTEGMVVNFAKCCWPIPGDPIVGFLSLGQGLTIHAEHCKNVAAFRDHPEKYVTVCWEDNVQGAFQVELRVEVENQRGMLANIASAIAETDANIETIRSEDKDGHFTLITLVLSVSGRLHLARIMRRIRALSAVNKITRSR